MTPNLKSAILVSCLLSLVPCLLFLVAMPGFAAEVNVIPLNWEAGVNQTVEINISFSAGGESINAISGEAVFPQDILELQEIKDGNSIVSFWVEKPRLEGNRIIFAGIIPGGFNGENGLLFSLTFRALKKGQGIIEMRDITVLKNDGKGTAAEARVSNFPFLISEKTPAVQPIQIKDADAPESFVPEIAKDKTLFEGRWFVVFSTQDKISGIDHYEIKETRSKELGKWLSKWQVAESPYVLRDQDLRSYVYVKAVDKSGNERIIKINPQNPLKWYEHYENWIILIIIVILAAYFRRGVRNKEQGTRDKEQGARSMGQGNNTIAYRKLVAWQKADDLAFRIYKITRDFPSEEKFSLVSQMRRAALSVPANIAEGYTRESKNEKVRFYNIAAASLTELEYYIGFSHRLSYISDNQHKELTLLRREVGKVLSGLATGTRNKWQTLKAIILIFLVPGSLFLAPSFAQAASLYFSPSAGSYSVGATFTTNVYVTSADQAMNAASGVISFNRDKLEIVSLSKSGSIIGLWVQEPSFSNAAGTANFEGIVLNPGFTGTGGKILGITFRAKAAGTANLSFSSGSVLANDGTGTNILASLGNATFSLGGAASGAPEAVTPTGLAGTPSAPVISSPTHPDPNQWYTAKTAKFIWNLPPDATGARLLVGRTSNAIPTVTYIPAINAKELSDVADGIWYFHVRLRNSAGWGGVSHFRFQIDSEKPTRFEIQAMERLDPTDPKAKFRFDAQDATSGIDHYEVQIDDGSSQLWKDSGSGVYETSALSPGKHTLIARAYDQAGNSLANYVEFVVEELNAPVITDYPSELTSGKILIVKGTTYPNAQIVLWLQREQDEPKSQIVKSNNGGKFTFVAAEKLKDGIYKMWAEAIDERGARSKPTEKVTIVVERPAILKIGSWAVSLLAVVIPLIALIIVLLGVIYYGWHKFTTLRKRIKKEICEAKHKFYQAFDLLQSAIREQIKMLEKIKTKRPLTKEEEKIINRLKKNLDDAEKLVQKEMEDIKREIK